MVKVSVWQPPLRSVVSGVNWRRLVAPPVKNNTLNTGRFTVGKHTKPHPITEDFTVHEQMAKDLDFYGYPDYATLIRRLSNAVKFKNAEIVDLLERLHP